MRQITATHAACAALLALGMTAPAGAQDGIGHRHAAGAHVAPAASSSAPPAAVHPMEHPAPAPGAARDDAHAGHPKPHADPAPHADHAAHGAAAPAAAAPAAATGVPASRPGHAGMRDMSMPAGDAPAGSRSGDYSDGMSPGAMTGMDMRDDAPLAMLLFDRLEAFSGGADHGREVDAQGWYGDGANRLMLKAEGEHGGGRFRELRAEALWARPIAPYWDLELGVRHDAGTGPGRTYAALGVQGLAPYWFDVEATFYVGASGRTALRGSAEYELLITQRLILQPRVEVNIFGRADPRRGLGAGLTDAVLGLRLRYEFTRKFAPYLGVEFARTFGGTASLARDAGEAAFDRRVVAGVRLWF